MSRWFAELQRVEFGKGWATDFSGRDFQREDDDLNALYERLVTRARTAPLVNYRIVDENGVVVWQWVRSDSPTAPPLQPPSTSSTTDRPPRRFQPGRI